MRIGVVSLSDVEYGLDVARGLQQSGQSVCLYLSNRHACNVLGSYPHTVENFYDLGLLPREVSLRLYNAPRMRDWRSLAVMKNLSQTICDDGVDIVYLLVGSGEFWLAVLAWLLRSLPVCAAMIIPQPNIGDHPSSFVVKTVNQLLSWGAQVIVVNGKNQLDYVQKNYGLPAERVAYVSLLPRFSARLWARGDKAEEPGAVLFFGRVDVHKGVNYLIQAQPLVSDQIELAHFIIAGQGPEFTHCRQLIQNLSCFELHEGFINSEMVAELFQRASLIVLPYISASTSGVLSAAQVFGKPVVASRVGSLPEYIEDGVTGLLVSPANIDELAAAIIRLLQDAPLRHRMGALALKQMETARDTAVRQTLSALEKTITLYRKHELSEVITHE